MDRDRHIGLVLASFFAVVAGGIVAGIVVWFAESAWGFAAGVATTVALWIARTRTPRELLLMAGYGLAFILVTWPVLVFAGGFVRYFITGQALGN
jgi:hypothetical protein